MRKATFAPLPKGCRCPRQMTFFYGVAKLLKHPPWGVTANICVPGRLNNVVWFSDAYPKTGGGEVRYSMPWPQMTGSFRPLVSRCYQLQTPAHVQVSAAA